MPYMTHDELGREWMAAWNAHDLERILSHYADDIVFESPFAQKLFPASGGKVEGKGRLREYFSKGLAAYPNLRFSDMRVYSGVNSFVATYTSVNGLRAAETFCLNSYGKIRRVFAHYQSASQ